jgi:flagellar biosynthesis protein FlhF
MMKVQSFSGATSREVLQKVKQALGDDALILSNREVDGGIEVVALPASEAKLPGAKAEPVATPVQSGESLEGILSEIQKLKKMLLQERSSAVSSTQPQPTERPAPGISQLLQAGFTHELASRAIASASVQGAVGSPYGVEQVLTGMLNFARADEVVEDGGVYALVGPTGVGKTTTVAKLAARAVVRFGSAKVALLTTDSYRIGGYDQLRIYARILGVAVHVIRDSHDLTAALAELSGRHLVLVDTVGMSHRDRMVAEQAALLAGAPKLKRLLLLQATTNAATLDHIVAAYREHGIDGCIITKTDEAASLAPALDAVIRHALPLHYVTDGQRVPEDLQIPDSHALLRDALSPDDGAVTDVDVPGNFKHPSSSSAAQARFAGAPASTISEGTFEALPKVMRPLGRHSQVRVVHG